MNKASYLSMLLGAMSGYENMYKLDKDLLGLLSNEYKGGGHKQYAIATIKKYNREQIEKQAKKPKRNEKCPCGSGKKYKYCCMIKIKEI